MGIQLRKMLRSRVVVVFGATSRIGKATIEELTLRQQGASLAVIAAVEDVKDPRARRLKRGTNCYLVKCKFSDLASIRHVVRNVDSVLLVPALSDSGTRFSKRVIDAVQAETVARLVIISSVLATHDFWPREASASAPTTDSSHAGPATSAVSSAGTSADLGYEAVEAHARSVLSNCVSLRIPLLMESVMYCRDEVLFANRFVGCFAPETLVPCIAVADVAAAAGHVLAQPTRKFNAAYCLAHADVVISPHEMEQRFSRALGKRVKYRQVPDEQLVALLRESGATLYVAQSMVRLKHRLEPPADNDAAATVTAKRESEAPVPSASPTPGPDAAAARRRQLARLGFTNDFEQLVGRKLMAPTAWLEHNAKHFVNQNQMQLFVVGSGEGFFAEFERFLAAQVTSATAVPAQEVGEAAIPTTAGGTSQGKVTFCAIKSIPTPAESSCASQQQPRQLRRGASESHFYQLQGGILSPLNQLLKQLSELDVIVYIPPLHLSATERVEVTKVVVDAAVKARVWGIVVVSSMFTGLGSSAGLNHLGEMERYVERSGVPYAIVRLPLFMEYFLALSSTDHALAHAESERSTASPSATTRRAAPAPAALAAADKLPTRQGDEMEEKQRPPPHSTATQERLPGRLPGRTPSQWNLLDRSLASSRMYLIAMADAAKALAAIAFTFPLHRGRTRTLYTECLTMHEIEAVLQEHAYKGRAIDFAQVSALREEPGREFWKVAYWTSPLVKELLECSVTLSAQTAPVEMPMTFGEVTECEPISLARWARANAKSYTHALEVAGES